MDHPAQLHGQVLCSVMVPPQWTEQVRRYDVETSRPAPAARRLPQGRGGRASHNFRDGNGLPVSGSGGVAGLTDTCGSRTL